MHPEWVSNSQNNFNLCLSSLYLHRAWCCVLITIDLSGFVHLHIKRNLSTEEKKNWCYIASQSHPELCEGIFCSHNIVPDLKVSTGASNKCNNPGSTWKVPWILCWQEINRGTLEKRLQEGLASERKIPLEMPLSLELVGRGRRGRCSLSRGGSEAHVVILADSASAAAYTAVALAVYLLT